MRWLLKGELMKKILYFDIDGVLLDYDEQPKLQLLNNKLEVILKQKDFKLVCVSGWTDIFNCISFNKSSELQKEAIYNMLLPIFSDKTWFIENLDLVYETDQRTRYFDFNQDWFYIDDWADKFFQDEYGIKFYKQLINSRILLVDPYGDGSDILNFLSNV